MITSILKYSLVGAVAFYILKILLGAVGMDYLLLPIVGLFSALVSWLAQTLVSHSGAVTFVVFASLAYLVFKAVINIAKAFAIFVLFYLILHNFLTPNMPSVKEYLNNLSGTLISSEFHLLETAYAADAMGGNIYVNADERVVVTFNGGVRGKDGMPITGVPIRLTSSGKFYNIYTSSVKGREGTFALQLFMKRSEIPEGAFSIGASDFRFLDSYADNSRTPISIIFDGDYGIYYTASQYIESADLKYIKNNDADRQAAGRFNFMRMAFFCISVLVFVYAFTLSRVVNWFRLTPGNYVKTKALAIGKGVDSENIVIVLGGFFVGFILYNMENSIYGSISNFTILTLAMIAANVILLQLRYGDRMLSAYIVMHLYKMLFHPRLYSKVYGFSMVELLVVIAITATLSGVAYNYGSKYFSDTKENFNAASVQSLRDTFTSYFASHANNIGTPDNRCVTNDPTLLVNNGFYTTPYDFRSLLTYGKLNNLMADTIGNITNLRDFVYVICPKGATLAAPGSQINSNPSFEFKAFKKDNGLYKFTASGNAAAL